MPETLYLVCGLLSDETVWEHQIDAFSRNYDVRVAKFPGYESIGKMARAVINEAPDQFSMAGHSMGGRVALEVYRMLAGRIRRLALLDTGIYPAHEREPRLRQELIDSARLHGMKAMAETLWIPSLIHPDRLDDASLTERLSAMAQRTTVEQFERQIRALLNRPDMSGLLSTIECNTLVLCGRQDQWASEKQHVEMARRIRNADLEIIDHCGHMTTMEHPRRVTDLLLEWLSP